MSILTDRVIFSGSPASNDLIHIVDVSDPTDNPAGTSFAIEVGDLLSGATFTGNTSGDCITDLYITNLYGCSPITVHDNIKNVTSTATGSFVTVFGSGNTSTADFTFIGGGKNNVSNSSFSIVGNGTGNTAYSYHNIIIGGIDNKLYGNTNYSIIGGGSGNQMLQLQPSNHFSTIINGENNVIGGNISTHSLIGGGSGNTISGSYSFIGGGAFNKTDGGFFGGYDSVVGGKNNSLTYSFFGLIGGGQNNNIIGGSGASPYGSSIAGGFNNTITKGIEGIGSSYSVIAGGSGNTISATVGGSILGGMRNLVKSQNATQKYGTIVSGLDNYTHRVLNSTIVGGQSNNLLLTENSTILGGTSNSITNNVIGGSSTDNMAIVAGSNNTITSSGEFPNADHSIIGGGNSNTITTSFASAIVNGRLNTLSTAPYSFIGGGSGNTINGGDWAFIGNGVNNSVSSNSDYSTILGGNNNSVNHSNSHIIGSNITSVSANTTHVEKLNIGTLNGTAINVGLGLDVNGMVVSGSTGGGGDTYSINVTQNGDNVDLNLDAASGTDSVVQLTAGNNITLTRDSAGEVTITSSGGLTIDPYEDVGNVNSITWDVSGTSTNYEATLTGVTTLTMSNVRNGDYGTLIVTQDGTGSHTLSFVGGTHKVVNGGGGAPTLTTTAGATDILSFTYNGSTFYWTVGNDYT
jgi:hypothetical protein